MITRPVLRRTWNWDHQPQLGMRISGSALIQNWPELRISTMLSRQSVTVSFAIAASFAYRKLIILATRHSNEGPRGRITPHELSSYVRSPFPKRVHSGNTLQPSSSPSNFSTASRIHHSAFVINSGFGLERNRMTRSRLLSFSKLFAATTTAFFGRDPMFFTWSLAFRAVSLSRKAARISNSRAVEFRFPSKIIVSIADLFSSSRSCHDCSGI